MSSADDAALDLLFYKDWTTDDAVVLGTPSIDGTEINQQTVDTLLSSESFPYAVDQQGRSLLHLTSVLGLGNMVKLLLKGGANANGTDQAGRTAVDVARSHNRTKVVQMFEEEVNKNTTMKTTFHTRGFPSVASVYSVTLPPGGTLPCTLEPKRIVYLALNSQQTVQCGVIEHAEAGAMSVGIAVGDVLVKVDDQSLMEGRPATDEEEPAFLARVSGRLLPSNVSRVLTLMRPSSAFEVVLSGIPGVSGEWLW